MTAHELAADWEWMERHSGFTMGDSPVVWERAEYTRGGYSRRVKISRLVALVTGLRCVVRYVDPMQQVTLVLATEAR